jgi:hypothetical protein
LTTLITLWNRKLQRKRRPNTTQTRPRADAASTRLQNGLWTDQRRIRMGLYTQRGGQREGLLIRAHLPDSCTPSSTAASSFGDVSLVLNSLELLTMTLSFTIGDLRKMELRKERTRSSTRGWRMP